VSIGAIVAFFAFFIVRSRNYGGWCVGMRWLIPVMPLLMLYFGLWLDRVRVTRVTWALVLLAFSISCFNVQDSLTSPFQYSVWHNWLEDAPNRYRVGKTFNVPKARSKSRASKASKAKKNKAAAAVPADAPAVPAPTPPLSPAVPAPAMPAPSP
jgi:hypothetical protein